MERKLARFVSLVYLVLSCHQASAQTPIQIDPTKEGRVFEGIGALSAGASSRLLIDYPDAQRRRILDYLFKPRFGASFQHLKVEIGGDVNSTCGTEPAFAHTREEFTQPRPEYFRRGYEYWLMSEARKRNPAILLDALQWGAPNWIGDGNFYSADNAEFIAAFHAGADKYWGVKPNYTGIWNETDTDFEWVKKLRETLDRAGLRDVGIIAGDDLNEPWEVVDRMKTDESLSKSIHAIGGHYLSSRSPEKAQSGGKTLWAAEDGPWAGDWYGASKLAKLYNRNYIEGRFTKTIVWSLITSYFDLLPLPGSGVMRANQPWSGSFEVQPALWVTAHTTQFAEPGWVYLDSACGYLPGGGSYVTLKRPDKSGDYSVVVETMDKPYIYPYWGTQKVEFELGEGLSDLPVYVWKTNFIDQFVLEQTIKPENRRFTVELQGESIYTLSTTTGQRKGDDLPIPYPKAFPFPYADGFERYPEHQLPRYFSDQAGVFEVRVRPDSSGKCLSQVVPKKGIEWHFHKNPEPGTFLGDSGWRNYVVSLQARLEGAGFVSIFGRVGKIRQNDDPPDGYCFKIDDAGRWQLKAGKNLLREGQASFSVQAWHALSLRFEGDTITAAVDGQAVATLEDATYARGMAGLGSGWHPAFFDDFVVESTGRMAVSPF